MKKIIICTLFSISGLLQTAYGRQTTDVLPRKQALHKTAAGCDPTVATIDLDINNVKARIMTGGDMWWDRAAGNAAYEVPKNSNKNALFAGSLWIGGVDDLGNLKVSAQTYRQDGNDYWTGPLNDLDYSIDYQTCAEWDRFWKVNASDIAKIKNVIAPFEGDPQAIKNAITLADANGLIEDVIKEWPAKGSTDILSGGGNPMSYVPNRPLADFVDVNSDGKYNWRDGDYPNIVGDQYIWWVFNDVGNAKTQTSSDAMGVEVHAAAFAFATSNCLNDATFYNFRLHKNSPGNIDSTFVATFSDADLGNYADDYIGCDTSRGLGILYNGDNYDEGVTGYGFDIPMIGVDYFQGPVYFNTTTQKNDTLQMSSFTYFNNGDPTSGKRDPRNAKEFYNYMTGSWKDGTQFSISSDGYVAGTKTKYVFFGDPCKVGTWSEARGLPGGSPTPNVPADRRFVHSAGPFTLVSGATPSNITIGAIWVPNTGGGTNACFSKIQVCDDKAQSLFLDNFKLPSGPNAPKTVVQALDRKLVFELDNISGSNNFNEGYGVDADKLEIINKARGNADSTYKFEGYIVYQLKNSQITLADIRNKDGSINTEKAKIVFQCDKVNGIKGINNFEIDPDISATNYIPKLMTLGSDNGIKHSFQLSEDAFSSSASRKLVNYKTYYYAVIAYGYNNFREFDENDLEHTQDLQYIESRTAAGGTPIQIIKAMPHPATDSLYIQTYADYGTGIEIKRIEGKGNGGVAMDLTEASEAEALKPPYQSYFPTYKPNAGPFILKVVNPDSVKAGSYEVRLVVDSNYSRTSAADSSLGAYPTKTTWYITRNTVDTIYSGNDVTAYNEKYLRKYLSNSNPNPLDWGLMAAIVQQKRAGDNPESFENGLITSSVVYSDPTQPWLSGVPDRDGDKTPNAFLNWIRAGQQEIKDPWTTAETKICNDWDWDNPGVVTNKDQYGTFEKVINGTFAPYNLTSNEVKGDCGYGLMYGIAPYPGSANPSSPAYSDRRINKLEDVYSVDIVLTNDKSLWTRCPVIEMTDNYDGDGLPMTTLLSEGAANKFNLRKHAGWNKDVDANGNPVYSTDPNDNGMSYFPGYAINIETGERLSMAFGEESFNTQDNGRDMIWNPTSRLYEYQSDWINHWGGKHIIYVSRTRYDYSDTIVNNIRNANNTNEKANLSLYEAYRSMMWVGVPALAPNFSLKSIKEGIIPTETRIKIRVTRPYAHYNPDGKDPATLKNGGWPLYTFNTDGIAPVKIGDAANYYTNHKDEALKRVHAVPNPYYAVSEYESDRLDTRIKIINLPDKATIKIYTLDGNLVRTINKNDNKTNYVDWDLKNSKNIPVVSGMYLIHVNIPGVGETVIKWFGAMRPVDITNF